MNLCPNCKATLPTISHHRNVCLECGADYGHPIELQDGRFHIPDNLATLTPQEVNLRALCILIDDLMQEV